MTGQEIAFIITAVASLVAAIGSATSMVMVARQGRRIDQQGVKLEEVHQATNGINKALVKVTGEAEFAKGVKVGEGH